jgi:D-3-phosphoglycerate dehydrogenase / 2-oxoglutarate reductase
VAILGTRFRDFDIERELLPGAEIVSGPGGSRAEIVDVAGGAALILAGAAPRFDRQTLEEVGARAIVRLGVGFDSVDLDAARSLGMTVAYVPDYGTETVALHTVSLVLASIRRIKLADQRTRDGEWGVDPLRPLRLPSSLTAGIVGFGRIGRRVGSMLAGLGFRRFLVTDPMVEQSDVGAAMPEAMAELVSLDELLAGSDVVMLHAPTPEEGGYLIGARELSSMKEGSALINTARGALVDTAALVRALGAGRPGVAALDVYETEPPDPTVFEPVADRILLTPHMSWYTEETEEELRRKAAAEARRILSGEPPLHPLVTPMTVEAR